MVAKPVSSTASADAADEGTKISRKEQAANTRAKLVDVGRRMFTEHGYDGTSVSAILAEANMAKGALYHHFPEGKRGLFRAVVDVVDEQLHDGFEHILATVQSPRERILAGFTILLDLAVDREFARIILVEASVVFPGEWVEGGEYHLLRATLAEAMEVGELRPLPLDATSTVLYGAARRAADHVAVAPKPKAAARDNLVALSAVLDGLKP